MLKESAGVTQPDILEVIADLSNDEVFTPPKIASAILDQLPETVWTNPDLRWLDPGAKTGVFLREVSKRLLVGLEKVIPDEKSRLEHILKNMIFGLAITDLTSMMSRRTLYCSKDASSDYSAVKMSTPAGNIWFNRIDHNYVGNRCKECGASKDAMEKVGKDNYAYAFIHKAGLSQVEKEIEMKFDVIVGNPPYQMDDEGGHRPVPLYHLFVEQAKALNPRYIAMITPSRWMGGGLGLNQFRESMLQDSRIRKLVDFPVPTEVFPGVEIKGGVSYFFWDRDNPGKCQVSIQRNGEIIGPHERDLSQFDIFVRDSRALPILEKVLKKRETSFSDLVSSVRPFGNELRSNFKGYRKPGKEIEGDLKLFMNEGSKRVERWVSPDFVENNQDLVKKWKIYIPKAGSDGGQRIPDVVLGPPFVGGPNTICTETYLAVGPFNTKKEAEFALVFLKTKFARFLISLRKISQDTMQKSFQWVPQEAWDHAWTDDELRKRYGITTEESEYINLMIRDMA
jgi:site-specific DNA-methyltransferase (adenine-specific)